MPDDSLMRPEHPDQVFGPPWYRDADKLLQAVLDRAGEDPAFAARVIEQIGSWAAKDMRHRDTLKELLKASKPGRQRVPYWMHVHLLASYNFLRYVEGWSHTRTLEWFKDGHFNLPNSTAENRLTQARKVVRPSDVLFPSPEAEAPDTK